MSGLGHLVAQTDRPGSSLVAVGPRILTLEQQRDAVRLLIDMAAALNRALGMLENDRGGDHQDRVLLARFAALNQKAGTA